MLASNPKYQKTWILA